MKLTDQRPSNDDEEKPGDQAEKTAKAQAVLIERGGVVTWATQI